MDDVPETRFVSMFSRPEFFSEILNSLKAVTLANLTSSIISLGANLS